MVRLAGLDACAIGFDRQGRRSGPAFDALGKGYRSAAQVVVKLMKDNTGHRAVTCMDQD